MCNKLFKTLFYLQTITTLYTFTLYYNICCSLCLERELLCIFFTNQINRHIVFNVPRSQFPTTVHPVVVLHIIMLPSCPPAICLTLFLLLWETTRHIRQVILSALLPWKCGKNRRLWNRKHKVVLGWMIWRPNGQGHINSKVSCNILLWFRNISTDNISSQWLKSTVLWFQCCII